MATQLKNPQFIYQNIRSMRRNTDKLLAYVNSLQERPLIIALSEVWIYDDEYSDFVIDGYTLFLKGNSNIRSGGVAIYANSKLNCSQVVYNFQTFDALAIKFSLNSKTMIVLCIYRFGFTFISDFFEEFSILLSAWTCSNLIICGDFNLDLLQKNSTVDEFLDLLSRNGLEYLISEATRITDTSATCIDNILFRFDQRSYHDVQGTVLNLKISDHCLLAINFTPITQPRQTYLKPTVTYTDNDKLRNMLVAESWRDVYSCLDASEAFDNFIKIFLDHVNRCTTSRTSSSNSVMLQPWMSSHLLSLIRKRNKFCWLAKKHMNNSRLRNYSSKLCDLVNAKIVSAKTQYYTTHFQSNGKDARKNWRLVNEIISGRSEHAGINEIIDGMGSSITSAPEIANKFNSYFTGVGNNCSYVNLSPVEINRLTSEHGSPVNSFFFSPATPGELYGIINSIRNTASPGIDGIPNGLVKKMACYLVDILTYLINLSVNTGVFPALLKRAVVIPIFKKNDKTCLNNYRPIALLSVFSKIYEKAMKRRVLDFLEANSILSGLQFGFREKKNTELALLSFLETVTSSIDQGLKVSALFVDMTKAFDRVDHRVLLNKLFAYGFRGCIQKWFQSYLHGRTQRVKVDGHLSSELSVNVGVPQGSVLGPLLFLVYINGIFKQDFLGSIVAFADDLSFSYATSSFPCNITSINHDLQLLSRWLSVHNMQLSNKTKLIHFRERNSLIAGVTYHVEHCKRNVTCSLDSCFTIDRVQEFRYLGVQIDENLNWKAHIESLKSKLLLVARKMYALRMYAPNYVQIMVYYALADSLLQYGLSCWGSACKTTLTPVYVRQKHLLRIISSKDRRSPSWPIFQELGLLPLKHMFVFKVLRIFYNISGNNFVNHAGFNLRSNHLFKKNVPNFKLDLRRYFFTVVSPIIFNNLPLEIRSCCNLSVFSKNLRDWLTQTSTVEQLFSVAI